MITPRAYLFGFVGFCFYLIALVNTLPTFYYALTWLTAAVLASSLGIALLSLVGVSCDWRVSRTRVSENLISILPEPQEDTTAQPMLQEISGPTIECTLSNAGTLNKTDVVIEVRLHERWRDETLQRRFLLEVLPSGNSVTTSLVLHDLPRGRYRVLDLRLIGSDVLGLFRMQKRLRPRPAVEIDSAVLAEENVVTLPEETPTTEIIIGPAMLNLALEHGGQEAGAGRGGIQAAALVGQSDETRGTRPYVAGDDLRFVHWKSTARHGQLVVREFDRSSQRQAIVVWDGAAGTNYGEGDFSTREQGLRLVASLCRVFHDQAQPCAMLRLDSHPLWVPPGGSGLRRAASLSVISESLADADTERETSLLQALTGFAGHLQTGSDLLLVTGSLSPAVPQAAQWCRSRGLNVIVGLVDGAAFLHAWEIANRDASYDLLWRPVLHSRTPQEHWEAGADGSGTTLVNAESFRAQENKLREMGIQVAVLTMPVPTTADTLEKNAAAETPRIEAADLTLPVRTAMRDMLKLRHTPNSSSAGSGSLQHTPVTGTVVAGTSVTGTSAIAGA